MSREDDRDVGVSSVAMSFLGSLFGDDPDAPEPVITRHFVTEPRRNEWSATPRRSACGIDGLQAHARNTSLSESGVTCKACKAELATRHQRDDKRALARVRSAPVSVQKIESGVRDRLVRAGLAKVERGYVVAVKGAA